MSRIYIANCTSQMHRVHLPDGTFLDVPPHDERRADGEVHAAHAIQARYGAVLVGASIPAVPRRIILLYSDRPIPHALRAAAEAHNIGAMPFVPNAPAGRPPPGPTPQQDEALATAMPIAAAAPESAAAAAATEKPTAPRQTKAAAR